MRRPRRTLFREAELTTREFYLERRKAERPVFLKVLRALPADRLDYTPHERSPSARQLVWTLASELRAGVEVVKEGRTEWRTDPAPALEEMIGHFEKWSTELVERVAAMSEEAWERPAKFYFGGKLVSEQPASEFLWMIHFDAIHHRGQLAAYLRPMGGKVPAIYGPSADEKSGS
jgi:uncharacterized damage-inducible protein DinB